MVGGTFYVEHNNLVWSMDRWSIEAFLSDGAKGEMPDIARYGEPLHPRWDWHDEDGGLRVPSYFRRRFVAHLRDAMDRADWCSELARYIAYTRVHPVKRRVLRRATASEQASDG